MAYHETALDAIFEDSLSDAELEEGKMAEDDEMDVDTFNGKNIGPEDGEVLGEEPAPTAPVNEPGLEWESGQGKESARPPQQKKLNRKRSGKRSKGVNVAGFVRDTCKHLQERKYPLVWAAVKHLGVDGVRGLIKEVDVIERCRGQMTIDGKRRRTPGGVMWNILRSRVPPAVYKEIMSQGNEVQKQKDKRAKESLKRNRMDVDEPVNKKRQKLNGKQRNFSGSEAPGKQRNQSWQSLRPAKELLAVVEGPQKDNSSLPAIHLQKAWAEGIKKKEDVGEAAVVSVPSLGAEPEGLKVWTATAGRPEKKSVPLFERLRIHVGYGDLVTERKSAPFPPGQIAPLERSDPVEGTPHDGGRQSPEHCE